MGDIGKSASDYVPDILDTIKDRIVGFDRKPADQFRNNPSNYRLHPKEQERAVRSSLKRFGWVDVAIENVTTGNLIDGHERIWQAQDANNADVPFIQVELSEQEELEVLSVLDAITAMAGTDTLMLADLLDQVSFEEQHLQNVLDTLAIEAEIMSLPDVAEQEKKALKTAVSEHVCPKCGFGF